MSAPGALSPVLISPRVLDGLSSEVQAVLDNMPNPVSDADEARIIAIVDPAVASGVWDQIDFFFCFAMADPDNALTSWIGTKTATNVNAATHTALQGYLFNGTTQHLDTNINLNTEGVNYLQDSADISIYCFDFTSGGDLFGSGSGADDRVRLRESGGSILAALNCTQSTVEATGIADTTRYGFNRTVSTEWIYFKDGVLESTEIETSDTVTTIEPFIGAFNNNGAACCWINAEVSYALFGGGIDPTDLDTMLDTVETEFSL